MSRARRLALLGDGRELRHPAPRAGGFRALRERRSAAAQLRRASLRRSPSASRLALGARLRCCCVMPRVRSRPRRGRWASSSAAWMRPPRRSASAVGGLEDAASTSSRARISLASAISTASRARSFSSSVEAPFAARRALAQRVASSWSRSSLFDRSRLQGRATRGLLLAQRRHAFRRGRPLRAAIGLGLGRLRPGAQPSVERALRRRRACASAHAGDASRASPRRISSESSL